LKCERKNKIYQQNNNKAGSLPARYKFFTRQTMKAKHTFKYVQESAGEKCSPIEVTFEIPTGEVTISEMLYNFECYLRACGFVFDGHLEVVGEVEYAKSEEDDTVYGCMADWNRKNDATAP
jgi:hypothetical protein